MRTISMVWRPPQGPVSTSSRKDAHQQAPSLPASGDYHGIFVPASRWRRQVIPLLSERSASAQLCASAGRLTEDIAPAVTEATGPRPGHREAPAACGPTPHPLGRRRQRSALNVTVTPAVATATVPYSGHRRLKPSTN